MSEPRFDPPPPISPEILAALDRIREQARRHMLRLIIGMSPDGIGPVVTDHDRGDEHDGSVIRECLAESYREHADLALHRFGLSPTNR